MTIQRQGREQQAPARCLGKPHHTRAGSWHSLLNSWTSARPCGQGPRATFEPISVPDSMCKTMHVEAAAEAPCHGHEQELPALHKSRAGGNVRALQNWPHPPTWLWSWPGADAAALCAASEQRQSQTFISTGWQNSGNDIISPSLPEPLENACSSPALILHLLSPAVTFSKDTFRLI